MSVPGAAALGLVAGSSVAFSALAMRGNTWTVDQVHGGRRAIGNKENLEILRIFLEIRRHFWDLSRISTILPKHPGNSQNFLGIFYEFSRHV